LFYLQELLKLYNPLPFRHLEHQYTEIGKPEISFGGSIPAKRDTIDLQTESFDAVVVGDSFAESMAGAFDLIARNNPRMRFLLSARYACFPMFSRAAMDVKLSGVKDPNCALTKRPQMLDLARRTNASRIIISGKWPSDKHIFLGYKTRGGGKTGDLVRSDMQETIEVLLKTGRPVIVIGAVPGARMLLCPGARSSARHSSHALT
jgi:hypothetical protein